LKISDYYIKIGNATDVGKVREQNEDYMAHFLTPIGYCIIVCDGMGGHAAGQVASQNSVLSIQQFLQDAKNENLAIPIVLKNAIEFANYQLREMVNKNPELKGMGTTCVMALINNGKLYTAHAGDSRIYLIRKGKILQITKDHSSVQKLIDLGVITEEEAELSDKRNEIIKAIGIFEKVDPTITQTALALHKNDKLLLCSDGLTSHVNKYKINETVQSVNDIQSAALKLIAQANDGGGTDNITVQLIHYTGKTVAGKRKLAIKKMVALFILLVAVGYLSFWLYRKNYGHHRPENATHKASLLNTFNMPQDTKAIEHTKNKSTSSKK
jgi:serine/threonine protein phosphatase PrpC